MNTPFDIWLRQTYGEFDKYEEVLNYNDLEKAFNAGMAEGYVDGDIVGYSRGYCDGEQGDYNP